VSLLLPFLFTQLEISTAGTFSHVYVCTQHINTDQYRFYALNYLPNFGGFFGDQNLNLVNSGWQPEILDNFPSLIRF
jgi:hypothetical protein